MLVVGCTEPEATTVHADDWERLYAEGVGRGGDHSDDDDAPYCGKAERQRADPEAYQTIVANSGAAFAWRLKGRQMPEPQKAIDLGSAKGDLGKKGEKVEGKEEGHANQAT